LNATEIGRRGLQSPHDYRKVDSCRRVKTVAAVQIVEIRESIGIMEN